MCNARPSFRFRLFALCAAAFLAASSAHAGLTFNLFLYRSNQGRNYGFNTPLTTNATAPAAALGTYVISSPHFPTNGASRTYQLTPGGLALVTGSENLYNDFNSVIYAITNGAWSIVFTNTTATNYYKFTVSAPTMTSNTLPATISTLPAEGQFILSSQTNFTWQGPTNWSSVGYVQISGNSYFETHLVPASQESLNLDTPVPAGEGYAFTLQFNTNHVTPVFLASTPLRTNDSQPISGWISTSSLESASYQNFSVFDAVPGSPGQGHTCLAYDTFEDNNLFAHDFSGNNNTIQGYATFGLPPFISTNDAAFGTYAGGFTGSGWWNPPDTLLSPLAGSFSVSLWLKTTNFHGYYLDTESTAVGIVSAFSGDFDNAVMPMGLTGRRIAFFTGGSSPSLLHSRSDIPSGQYVHVVTTRDQATGEKKIYINGALDTSAYGSTNQLTGPDPDGFTIGENNGQAFQGRMDEIQFYSGVLSSNEVNFLYTHLGSRIADTLQLDMPVARFDFEATNAPGQDTSGRYNNSDCSMSTGPLDDIPATNSAVGAFARQFFGDTSFCFSTFSGYVHDNLSNALAGNFTVTAWVNTTNSVSTDGANAFFGMPVFFAYSGLSNTTVPLSITGSKAAFTVYDQYGVPTTLHSTATVNDGQYHFLAVTRTRTNGLMNLYVDGRLEDSGTSTTQAIVSAATLYLASGASTQYQGLMDDVRLYAFALNSEDLATLFGHPSFNTALNTTAFSWLTSGDTPWFVETTNTFDGIAAQSGSVTNTQTSRLAVTVNGPGTLTFYWSCIANDSNAGFYYEFDIDDIYWNSISGDTGWYQDGAYAISPGPHELSWTAYADGDTDPTQAGYLDQVSFVPTTAPNTTTLINPQIIGTTFQFQFQSLAGFSHDVLYRTNLIAGSGWQNYTTVGGDGTLKTVPLPLSLFGPARQGFIRVSTH